MVEGVRAICCLVQTGQIIFDLDGHLIEESDSIGKRTKIRMKKIEHESFASATDFILEFCIPFCSHFSFHLCRRDDKFEVFQVGPQWAAQFALTPPCL